MAWLIKIFINLCTCIMAIVHEKPYPHKTITKMEILFKYAAKFSDNENLTKAIIFATKKAFF